MTKIAICGYSPTLSQAPFYDNEWLIYSMNHRTEVYRRFDLHFDLHDTTKMQSNDFYYHIIKQRKEKSVLTGIDKRFNEATIYPQKEIMEKYGSFFTCSAAWMIAYAVEQNPTDIGIYGIDCAYESEYIEQRPSITRMIGIAEGKGINLHYPNGCRLFNKKALYWNKTGKM